MSTGLDLALAGRSAASSARRSAGWLSGSTSDSSSTFLPSSAAPNKRMKAALVALMRPSPSTVAMAIGAEWNRRANLSSAAPASSASPGPRLKTSACAKAPLDPGRGRRCRTRTGRLVPSALTRSISKRRVAPWLCPRPLRAISAALSADMISSSLSARPATSERSRPSHCASVALRYSMVPSASAVKKPAGALSR